MTSAPIVTFTVELEPSDRFMLEHRSALCSRCGLWFPVRKLLEHVAAHEMALEHGLEANRPEDGSSRPGA